jgi:DNA recombination protein RmuC
MVFEAFLIILIITGFALLYWLLSKKLSQPSSENLEAMVDRVFGMSTQRVAEQSKQVLAGEREAIKVDLENKHAAIEKLVKNLQTDLVERQRELRLLEQDRIQKFGELSNNLETQRQLTQELQVSTEKLKETLSNNQLRGEWGEKIIEDLLRANGLVESIHYVRQSALGSSGLRPDISLLLPDKRLVAVDVKFPYREMQKMVAAESAALKKTHIKQFGIDIKAKIEKVSLYIAPEENTLDYAIMFVPNEMIFSFINQQYPELVDEAVRRRVLLVSPFTFLIVARTVMESYRNFLLGDKLQEVVKYVDEFATEWERFIEAFAKYGRSLGTLQTDYDQLMGTRVRQMNKRMERVQSLKSGSLATAVVDLESKDPALDDPEESFTEEHDGKK